ncbi:MAG: formylmethanofuran dehydrogenase subunit A [Gammaproteobacteria bacterium]|jgi:formylmethanofuran dehydrogenase subunit A
MLTRLTGGALYDPARQINGEVHDLYIRDGQITAAPEPGTPVDREYDLRGKVVMAGAIDMHTHIGGGKVNIARTMLPEDHAADPVPRTGLSRSGCGHAAPSTLTTGYRYAQMGYTACFEPAVLPSNARHAHLELGDTPMVDKGGYAMLGSDELLLHLMATGTDQAAINDYVAWTLHASQCLGIKVVNPGGISAFKFNQRELDVDEASASHGVTPRDIIRTLTRAVYELGVPHPLHVHASNLGVPGNFTTTLKTMEAAEGLPVHLTHIQFHSYGTEGDRKFSSAAAEIAEAVRRMPNVTVDVGQIMFGQTVTASGDTMHQYANRRFAHPHKWMCMDIECDAGCGVVPFRYRDKNFVNALQWAIGLELFLDIDDPWRVFLTTDHPNGAPFTSYPHLIRLLMDRSFRNEMLTRIHPDAAAHSRLSSLDREYDLYEIAIMTRAGPARVLGLDDRGHLGEGATADITVYNPDDNRERMFETPAYVFKDGELVVRDGQLVKVVYGRTHTVHPDYDPSITRRVQRYFEKFQTVRMENFMIGSDEFSDDGRGGLVVHTGRGRSEA